MEKGTNFHIGRIDILERDCIIKGTVCHSGKGDMVKFAVRDSQGEELAFESRGKGRRLDGVYRYLFEIMVPGVTGMQIRLFVYVNGKQYEHTISMTAARQPPAKVTGIYFVRRGFLYLRKKGIKFFLKKLLEKIGKRYASGSEQADYEKWRQQHQPRAEELGRQSLERFPYMPKISIVVPLYKTKEPYLRAMVDSVLAQSYGNWELCLSDGSGKESPIEGYLKELAEGEKRIVCLPACKPMEIPENTNRALDVSTGEWIGFMDHDDLLAPDALYECVKALNQGKKIDMIYSDEDKVSMDGQNYFQPHFKPDLNKDLLRSLNYICHFVLVSKVLLEQTGNLNAEYHGAQDHDFVLRCMEQTENIHHIPKVLYHWRVHQDSTAENPESKRYAFEAGAKAVEAHYRRSGIPAAVSQGRYPGQYITRYHWGDQPLVSIIIPNKDHIGELETCIRSIEEKSSYQNLEYIIVENNSVAEETFSYYEQLEKENTRVRVVKFKGGFNFSGICNLGAGHAKGEYLLFLNNDTEMINREGIHRMVDICRRPDVGVVGIKLLYPDNTIQHGGVIIGILGIAGHAFRGMDNHNPGYFSRAACTQDYSAVTAACMMTPRYVFKEAGGFREELGVAFNDVDYCLKVRELGKLVVYEPDVIFYHYESKSRGKEDSPEKVERFRQEIEFFEEKWADILSMGDPYYNPNLSLQAEDFSLKM